MNQNSIINSTDNVFKPVPLQAPVIKGFSPRLYQQTILNTCSQFNTLVCLPTGLGKTACAFLLAAQRLHLYPHSKILMLAPTKPLCEQHLETFHKHLDLPEENIVLFTGSVKPEVREMRWKDAQVIISTPQGLELDAINRRIRLEDVSLLIVDEAHRATGDYAYVWIADQYNKLSTHTRILALTASPGSDLESIKELCTALKIERVEVRTEEDNDVKPYIQPMEVQWVTVPFPEEYKVIQGHLKLCKNGKLLDVQKLGYCPYVELNKGEILKLQGELQHKISSGYRDYEILRSVSLVAEALKVDHAMELLETQGVQQLHRYFQKLQVEGLTSTVKAVKNLLQDTHFKSALYLAEGAQSIKHPKLEKLKELLTPEGKCIIFTQFRDSGAEIVNTLNEHNISNHLFVGQAKKNGTGLSQKQQKEILDKFREGEFSVLVATSVAEEGLDIPQVDKVIFYEPIPSAIRSIQRRGRTGRLEEGSVSVLVTEGTRDVAYRWSAHHKEKRMYRNLAALRKGLSLSAPEQPVQRRLIPEEQVVAVLADHREKDNKIVKELIELGVSVRTTQLESADYVVSGSVGVELKKIPDFVASIIDGRLIQQARNIKQHFRKAVLIIEGEEDIYAVRNIHPNAIRGMMSTLVLDFGIPILFTKNPHDTASLLAVMAKREQERDRDVSLHAGKPKTRKEQLAFIVSSFPNIGLPTARSLLGQFGSIKNMVNATSEELERVEGIGQKTAERLHALFEEKYKKDSE